MKQFSRQLSCHLRRWSIYAPAEVLALVGALVLGVQVSAMEFMAGADISSLPVHEEHGAVYKANNVTGDAIEILSNSGVDYYRLRLFVNPQFENNYSGGGDPFVAQDLDYTIALAQRVKQAGGKVLLDFHYSDTWADPGHQWKPEAWRSLTTMA
jgi:arabinogalactan endo-1,4-beta-galactosidase